MKDMCSNIFMNLRDSLRNNSHSEFIRKDDKYFLNAQKIEQKMYSSNQN